MDQQRFAFLTRSLTNLPSRRDVLRGLVGAGLGLATWRLPAQVEAKKCIGRRRRTCEKRPPVLNQYGCVDVGNPCRGNDDLCCSGICQGKKPRKGQKDKSRCAAHGVEGCQPDEDQCAFVQAPCGDGGICFRTTGNANFCGDFTGLCVACRTDPDCEAETGPGSACVVCPFCAESGGTACWPPPNPA
jgi:hypothetical protein